MEVLPHFELLRPATAAEAVALMRTHSQARLLGGGTDLLVNVRRGIEAPGALIDTTGIEEMRTIAHENGRIRIGAAVTLQRLIDDAMVKAEAPVIAQAAETIAGYTHRQSATVGGNLCLDTRCLFYNQSEWWRKANDYCLKYRGETCHVAPTGKRCYAAFSGDLAPALLVLDAEVEVASAAGIRTMALKDLYQDDGADHLTLAEGEMVVSVSFATGQGLAAAYRKVRVRAAVDFPLAGVAVALKRDGETLTDLRVALTGTQSFALRLDGTAELTGKPLDDAAIGAVEKLVTKQIQPMRSTFSPSSYRRKVALNVTRRLLKDLWG